MEKGGEEESCCMWGTDGPRGYYAKYSESDREQIPYDFTYTWNLKSKQTNKTETGS